MLFARCSLKKFIFCVLRGWAARPSAAGEKGESGDRRAADLHCTFGHLYQFHKGFLVIIAIFGFFDKNAIENACFSLHIMLKYPRLRIQTFYI